MSLDEVRELLCSHSPDATRRAALALIDVVQAQEHQISVLLEVTSSHETWCERRNANLQRQIDRLKRIHGA